MASDLLGNAGRAPGGGMSALVEALRRVPVVGIIRGCPPEHAMQVAGAAIEAGFTVLEVTLDSPEPLRSIRSMTRASGDALVGAGTVRTVDQAEAAVAAGAAFLVAPVVDSSVIARARQLGVPMLPGAATPTEIWRALDAGADAVKVFPATQLGGPSYIEAIIGPLDDPLLVPTGGVNAGNARPFLEAGALAIGVGTSVFPLDALRAGDSARVGSAAARVIEAVT